MNQVATVTTDGTQTESYTHDANNNVITQSITSAGTTTITNYGYDQGRLATASVVGAGTSDYNYDPFGRLDTVTSGGQTIQSNTYDGFDNLASSSQWNTTTGSMDTTSYTYDSLNRMASQTTAAGTSSFSYLGLSSQLASEQDPNSASKTYDYTPGGARLSQDTTTSGGTTTPGYYSYNAHGDVEALTGTTGTTTATYGYTAYGNPVTSMYTGQDKNTATASPTSTTQPYSAYRFNAMRWDSTSGSYDMGFRNYDPGLNQFASRDMYDGALADMGLTTDPFTGSQYAFGDGNPISNTEYNGHSIINDVVSGVKTGVSDLENIGSDIGGALQDGANLGGDIIGKVAGIGGDALGGLGVAWAFLNELGVNTPAGNSGRFTKTGNRPNYSNNMGRLITQLSDQEWAPGYSGSLAPGNNEDEQNCSVGASQGQGEVAHSIGLGALSVH